MTTILREKPSGPRHSEVHVFFPHEFLAFSLPARRTEATYWKRSNGEYTYTVTAGTILNPAGEPVTELPSGKYARTAAIYLFTRAKLLRNPVVSIPSAYRTAFKEMGMQWQGHATGTEAIRQLMLMAAATFSITRQHVDTETGEELYEDRGARFSESMNLWTTKNRSEFSPTGKSEIVLSPMMMEMLQHAVPINRQAWNWILANSRSPMALDVYGWLCGRLHRCTSHSRVTWNQLHDQFGSRSSLKRFKGHFREALQVALLVFPEAQIKEDLGTSRTSGFKGFHLYPSPDPRDSQLPNVL